MLATIIQITADEEVPNRLDDSEIGWEWLGNWFEVGDVVSGGCLALVPVIAAICGQHEESAAARIAESTCDDFSEGGAAAHDLGLQVYGLITGVESTTELKSDSGDTYIKVAEIVASVLRSSDRLTRPWEAPITDEFRRVIDTLVERDRGNLDTASEMALIRGEASVAGSLVGAWCGFSQIPGVWIARFSDADLARLSEISRLLLWLVTGRNKWPSQPVSQATHARQDGCVVESSSLFGGTNFGALGSILERAAYGGLVLALADLGADLRVPLSTGVLTLPWTIAVGEFPNPVEGEPFWDDLVGEYWDEYSDRPLVDVPRPGAGAQGLVVTRPSGWVRNAAIAQCAVFIRANLSGNPTFTVIVPDDARYAGALCVEDQLARGRAVNADELRAALDAIAPLYPGVVSALAIPNRIFPNYYV